MANQTQVEPMPSTDWHQIEFPTVTSDDSNERSGTYALKLTDSDSDNKIYFTQSTVSGEYYTLKFYSKVDLGDTLTAKVYDLGAELVDDGDFTGDGSEWTLGSGWAYNAGSNDLDATTSTANADNEGSVLTVGNSYYSLFDVTAYTGGTVRMLVGNTGTGTTQNAVGRYGEAITAAGDQKIYVDAVTSLTATIDNVSVKEVKDSWTKTSTSTSYEEISLTFKATGSSVLVEFYGSVAGDIIYLDDLSLTPLRKIDPSTNSATSSVPYVEGRWGGDNKALYMHGGNEYTFHDTSSHIDDEKGSFVLWYRPDYASDEPTDEKFLVSGKEFCRLYYQGSDTKFYYEMWDGDDWTTIRAASDAQAFASGTWIHVGATYDYSSGAYLYLSGTLVGSDTSTWTAQSGPDSLAVGCISGTLDNRAEGAIDDFRVYKRKLTSSEVTRINNTNYGSN